MRFKFAENQNLESKFFILMVDRDVCKYTLEIKIKFYFLLKKKFRKKEKILVNNYNLENLVAPCPLNSLRIVYSDKI